MRKYIASNKSSNMISEYDIDKDIIRITYSNGDIKEIPNSLENIKELDILMLVQHQEYQFQATDIIDKKDIAISLGIGATVSLVSFISGVDNINAEQISMYLLAGLSASILYNLLNQEAKLDSIENDYYKDELLLDNYNMIEDTIMNDEYYNCLSLKLREKLKNVHEGSVPLSINSIKDLNIREISNIICYADDNRKNKVRSKELR